MKIPESRAARERGQLRCDPVDHRLDPDLPDDPGIVDGYPADNLVLASHGRWIAKRKNAFAERDRSWGGVLRRTYPAILPQSFDTAESAACSKCVELAMVWSGHP